MNLAENICEHLTSDPNLYANPVEKFVKTLSGIVNKSDHDSTLTSALATFGRDQSMLTPLGRKKTIRVQPLSIARRTTFQGGSHPQKGGKPQKGVAEHAYHGEKRSKETATWVAPPKKKPKVSHSLQLCASANIRLPK